ncbi:MAG: lysine--tRNA ligase [Acidimicrobiales bacterium]|nr:lysine--tRNA ligase [Acidimicrobiales bacterium]
MSDNGAQNIHSEEAVGFKPAGRFEVDTLAAEASEKPDGETVRLAGRVMLWRPMGGIAFGQLQDRSGRVQFSFDKKALGADTFKQWTKAISIGDFIGIEGSTWTTQKGEKTVAVSSMTVLNKALRPMPDKWQGIHDPDLRYRKRYLDLLSNEQSRQRFLLRTKVIAFIRRFLDEAGFVEVETPILQAAASGAAARPFVTHHNALDRDFYLRISPETYLKRVVAGGFERVYELGRNFRNEGIDSSHLQEFTMLEWYAAYWDYRDNMRFVRKLIQATFDEILGTRSVSFEGITLDFGGDWPEIDYRTAVRDATGIDLREVRDVNALKAAIEDAGLLSEEEADRQVSYAGLVDLLYKRTVRPGLIQPCFLVHHPVELVPLARRNDDDPTILDMFQVVVNGWEIVKAYSELVDPIDQRARLEEQVALREQGDDETMMMEEDFLECMEHGMPPMSGLGLGIDRFVALLTDAPTLRDVVLFPQLREAPGSGPNDDSTESEA